MELFLNKAGCGRNLVVLLAGAPRSVEFEPVRDTLLSVPGVRATHDLHLWALTLTYHVASAHLAIGECALTQPAPSQHQPFRFHGWTTWSTEVLVVCLSLSLMCIQAAPEILVPQPPELLGLHILCLFWFS